MLDQLKSLAVFATVVEEGSFRGAGTKLSLSPSVISHHVAKLERELGAALILRSTRSMSLTEEGETLYASASAMLNEAKHGIGRFADRSDQNVIDFKIAMPSMLSAHPVFDKVIAFAKKHAGAHLHVMASDQTVDLLKGRYDIALRMGVMKDSELKSRKLADDERVTVASPEFAAQYSNPQTPSELESWNFIRFTPVPAGFTFTSKTGQKVFVKGRYVISTNSVHTMKSLALRGMGAAGIPACFVQDELKDRRLVKLLPEWRGQSLGIYAVWAQNAGLNPVHQAFLKAVV